MEKNQDNGFDCIVDSDEDPRGLTQACQYIVNFHAIRNIVIFSGNNQKRFLKSDGPDACLTEDRDFSVPERDLEATAILLFQVDGDIQKDVSRHYVKTTQLIILANPGVISEKFEKFLGQNKMKYDSRESAVLNSTFNLANNDFQSLRLYKKETNL